MPPKRSTPKRTPTPPRARPVAPDNPNTTPVMIRMDVGLQQELDAWVDRLNAAGEGPRWTRSDVIRVALQRALRERGAKGETP